MKIRGGPGDTLSNACLENKKNGIRDLSILQKPIQTSITGFKEVVKAYKDGTEEVSWHRNYLFYTSDMRDVKVLHWQNNKLIKSIFRLNCCWPTNVI